MIYPSLEVGGKLLTTTQLTIYSAALAQSHVVTARVQLLDSNEDVRSELGVGPIGVLGGQVDVDTTADGATRSASLTLLDPRRKLTLSPNGGGEYGLFCGDLVRVWRGDYVDALHRFVWCPIFTGPVTSFSIAYPEVSIECIGKEALALDPHLTLATITAHHGTLVTTAIRRVMAPTGEQGFTRFAETTARLAHNVSLPRWSEPWAAAKRLAGNANRQLYYDGRGHLVLRKRSRNPVYTFRSGEDGTLLAAPSAAYDFTAFRNAVDVRGGKPKKAKQTVRVFETVAKSNPLSPGALARNGVPQYLTETIDDSQILRRAKAEAVAHTTLAAGLDLTLDPSSNTFDTLPIPHLEERDLVRVQLVHGMATIELKRFSIPLGGDSMSVGISRTMRWKTKYRRSRPGRRTR